MTSDASELAGLKVTVMGLGLHGGGGASVRFFAGRGAQVTVTDLRNEDILAASVDALSDLDVRFVLGSHPEELFTEADMVIKNPAVPAGSPLLRLAKRIETDISMFLRYSSSPLVAVTGSKGKSTTASAIHYCLHRKNPDARLGGNITISPLTFLDEKDRDPDAPVVLELSSWQLADLAGRGILKPDVAVLTVIMPDHQDRYPDMDSYVADKRHIYRSQEPGQYTLCLKDDPFGRSFFAETPGQGLFYSASPPAPDEEGAWLDTDGRGFLRSGGGLHEILPAKVTLPGRHNRLNLLAAGTACFLMGVEPPEIADALAGFPGIEHRMEFVRRIGGVDYYNDSAATIPEAAGAAVESFHRPVVLIAGGNDKNLSFTPFIRMAGEVKGIVLLAGTASDKITGILASAGRRWEGPYDSMEAALRKAVDMASDGDIVILSPGCTSFGMFLNEFDRGRKYKDAVLRLPD